MASPGPVHPGKLRSNFIGTEFVLYDKGTNPEKLDEAQKESALIQARQELGTVLYKQNVLGSRGPRKMKVMVPRIDAEGQRTMLRPQTGQESMLERYKAAKNDADVTILKNKPPKWNDQVGAYVLNFNGRVTRASVKNFQLCDLKEERKPRNRAQPRATARARARTPTRTPRARPRPRPRPRTPTRTHAHAWACPRAHAERFCTALSLTARCLPRSRYGHHAVRSRGQGRLHNGLPAPALRAASFRHRPVVIRLQDCLRVTRGTESRAQAASTRCVRHSVVRSCEGLAMPGAALEVCGC